LEEQEQIEQHLRPARKKLLAARESRVKPQRDDNIITSWNALAVSALLDAYQTFGTPRYLSMAEQALTFLIDYAIRDGWVFRTVSGGRGRIAGYLEDYACLAAALLDAFEATSHAWYLDQSRGVMTRLLEQFWDDQAGGFFFTGKDHEPLIHRMKSGVDSAVPSGNAAAVQVLLRLFSLTGERLYDERAEQTLRVFHRVMDRNAYGTAALLCALDLYLSRPKEIVLIGDRGDAATDAFISTVHQRYVPNKIVLVLDESHAGREGDLPLASGKVRLNGLPTAYVCHRFRCSQPMTDRAQLESLL
jgi:uncharacterized protein